MPYSIYHLKKWFLYCKIIHSNLVPLKTISNDEWYEKSIRFNHSVIFT
jgi:hypothetical protein